MQLMLDILFCFDEFLHKLLIELKDLEFSVRAMNSLSNQGIKTIGKKKHRTIGYTGFNTFYSWFTKNTFWTNHEADIEKNS